MTGRYSRLSAYSPLTDRRFDGGRADANLRFDLGTLQPLVDRTFRILRGQEHAYLMAVRQVVETLAHKGYVRGEDLRYVEEQGGVHNEQAWARRLPDMIRFLLGARSESEV